MQMSRVVELHFGGGGKDPSVRSITQILLQKLRKGIMTAENEVSRLIAEILYGIVTLATLRHDVRQRKCKKGNSQSCLFLFGTGFGCSEFGKREEGEGGEEGNIVQPAVLMNNKWKNRQD